SAGGRTELEIDLPVLHDEVGTMGDAANQRDAVVSGRDSGWQGRRVHYPAGRWCRPDQAAGQKTDEGEPQQREGENRNVAIHDAPAHWPEHPATARRRTPA